MKALKDIFNNRKEILEGIKNRLFKQKHIEIVAKERWEQHCVICEFLDRDGKKCTMPGTQPCCGECGCSLALKMRSLSSACPKNKWPALLTDEEEDELTKNLNDEQSGSK
jgi:hypothetical protein